MKWRPLVAVLGCALAVAGCSSITNAFRELAGFGPSSDPSVALKPAETRWLLVQNPRYGDVASEPEYIWVEEDKVPTTLKTLIRGQKAIVAPPEIVAKYGQPPGGGKISPRQGMALPTEAPAPAASAVTAPVAPSGAATAPTNGKASAAVRPGVVIYVDTSRVAVDLTAADGVRPGTVLSLRRDRIPIVHPVTGEVLGDLDEEVATARITEVRDKFSVAELQSVAPGAAVQVKDRVVAK